MESALKQYATKEDLKTELKQYATREDLRIEIQFNTEEILAKVDENARNYRDEILTKLDGVMGELETIREDNLIGTHQISSLREQAEDHEKRIADLEKVQTSP